VARVSYTFGYVAIALLVFVGCGGNTGPLPVLSDKFHDIQAQTFDKSCIGSGCHDAATAMQKLIPCLLADSSYFDLCNNKIQANQGGPITFKKLVVPYQPDSSFLVYKLTQANGSPEYGALMPNNNTGKLPQNQIDAIISWIKRGAPND